MRTSVRTVDTIFRSEVAMKALTDLATVRHTDLGRTVHSPHHLVDLFEQDCLDRVDNVLSAVSLLHELVYCTVDPRQLRC